MPDPSHRASDAEREVVADRLRRAAAEGRLDPDELEERLASAYGARTHGELEPLTGDLPAMAPEPVPIPREPRLSAIGSYHVRRRLATFITVNVICVAIFLAGGANGSFWPIWVMLGTGIALFSSVVKALLGVDDEDEEDRRRHGRALPEPERPQQRRA